MQHEYFELWVGTWPEAIDWTAAVLNTFVSASLESLSWLRSQTRSKTAPTKATVEQAELENEINTYFSQSASFYFGEDAFAIRLQAYDDMLWVVLGWLESIKFIEAFNATCDDVNWYGTQFIPVFAHRARIFDDLAKVGYDRTLCKGGMLWNPGLLPYKNAITNELYIAASVGMYLHFPGDANDSPFVDARKDCRGSLLTDETDVCTAPRAPPASHTSESSKPYKPEFLDRAVEAYSWLKGINMTNDRGLYIDGFHIKDYGVNNTLGTRKCDVRNEMVYTYNQGVILSGLRGLWEATGQRSYLEDGHQLVVSVINATGWDTQTELHLQPLAGDWPWRGLGRAGILEELCDASGTCNQDAQTFKGIFFHHLTSFCAPLPRVAVQPGKTFAADAETAFLHRTSCVGYSEWVQRNARAALNTRDDKGRFGMWWTWGLEAEELSGLHGGIEPLAERIPEGSVLPTDDEDGVASAAYQHTDANHETRANADADQISISQDPNSRFRGRTVETQGGGLAVVRAMLEFAKL